jgi:hypothetical protein
MARERKSNRRGTRARRDYALLDHVEVFTVTNQQWRRLEEALAKPIPRRVRGRISKATSSYIIAAQAAMNAPFRDEHNKLLAETHQHATRLRTLLDDPEVATVAYRRFDEFLKDDDKTSERMTFTDGLDRVVSNCHTEIRRPAESGFVEGEAWYRWIRSLLKILGDAGLPHGVATPKEKGNVSPAVQVVAAIQKQFEEKRQKLLREREELERRRRDLGDMSPMGYPPIMEFRRHSQSLGSLAQAMLRAKRQAKR